MKNILVTGGLGHIGSQFLRSVNLPDYNEIIIVDNLLTQRYPSLFNLPEQGRFIFYEEDILDPDFEKHLENIDIVLHLAAITNAEGSFDVQEKVEEVNFTGTKKVAEACLKYGCKLIFLSTTSVYGTQDKVVDEDCGIDNLKPQSPYAMSKLKAENLLFDLGKSGGLKFVICRFGTIFGASIGMRFHTAVNKFIWQACLGKEVTVWKTAYHQKRPYLDLYDGVRAIQYIMHNEIFNNQVYNVLTANNTVSDIVEAIRTIIPDLKVTFVDSPIMNQLSYEVLNDKFSNLGFEFKGNLTNAIYHTAQLLQDVNYHVAKNL